MYKVGDIVWCKVKDKYPITDYHVKCIVCDIREFEYGYITVAPIMRGYICNMYRVEAKYFELVPANAKVV